MRTYKNEARAGNNGEEVVGYDEVAVAHSTHDQLDGLTSGRSDARCVII